MAYTQVGIVNLALMRIGAKVIASMSDGSPNQIKASAVYDYVLDEVLSAHDWKFAKSRVELGTGSETADTGDFGFDYAYELPSDFLRLAKDTKADGKDDPAIYPSGHVYKVEVVSVTTGGVTADKLCLLTDYDNASEDMYISYIKRQTDETLYFAAFINALAWRLAGELSTVITESSKKLSDCLSLYETAKSLAIAHDSGLDFVQHDQGNTDWEDAGR